MPALPGLHGAHPAEQPLPPLRASRLPARPQRRLSEVSISTEGVGRVKVKWWADWRSGRGKWPGNDGDSVVFFKGRVGCHQETGRLGAVK